MKEYKINNTFPKSIAPIIDINGLPIKQTDESFKKRIINFFKGSFCSFRPNTFKTDDGNDWKEYCNFLCEMVSDPEKLFGLVAIDGHHYDHLGSGDRAMVFNFGIPKLRGRKTYTLDRIYVLIEKRTSGQQLPRIRYWNSIIEDEGEMNFQWIKKTGAWHPHISAGSPCLGRYETALADQWTNGYVVVYLRTIHQFLNTWNRQSPYWDINHMPIETELGCGPHSVTFKESKLINPVRVIFGDGRMSLHRTIKDFIEDNFFKVDSGSIAYDIYYLVEIWKLCDTLKHSNSIENTIWNKLGEDMTNNIRQISRMAQEGIDNEYYDFSIFNKYIDGQILWTRIPNDGCSGVLVIRKDANDALREYLLENEIKEHKMKLDIVRSLCWFFQKLEKSICEGKVTESLVDDIKIEDYAIRLDATYLNPVEKEAQETFDFLTENSSCSTRVGWNSHESVEPDKARIIRKYNSRNLRIRNMIKAKVEKSIDKTDLKPYFDNLIFKYFDYTIYTNDSDLNNSGYMKTRGEFWPSMNISQSKHWRFDLVKEYMANFPKTLEECLIVYSKLKQDILALENKVALKCHRTVIRRLEKNVQINNTEENRRQVPLFFE